MNNLKLTDFFKKPEEFNRIVNQSTAVSNYVDLNYKTKRILQLQKGIDQSNKMIEDLKKKKAIIENDIEVYNKNVIELEKLQQDWLGNL